MQTKITQLLGIEIPIIQAPMGYIARAQLASAVSNAGGLGIIETSSGKLDEVKEEIAKMRDLTDKPWGVNIAQMFVQDPVEIVEFVAEHNVTFVTTSAGDPSLLTQRLKDVGIVVFHVVPTLRAAQKAVAAGVDGLVVEGIEGGGFKNPDGASSMVLGPLISDAVDVPIVLAGGVCDGKSMAAAFILGAEGVQMGTQMLAAEESPVHLNWKEAICNAQETDTLLLNRVGRPGFRVLRTQRTIEEEKDDTVQFPGIDKIMELYFEGDMEAAFAFAGQVTGRINNVRPVAEILNKTWQDCQQHLKEFASRVK